MRHVKTACVALAIILAIAFGYSLSVISRQSRRLAHYKNEQAQDQKSISQLRESLHKEQLAEARATASDQNSEQALRSALAGSKAALKASGKQHDADEIETAEMRTRLIRSRNHDRRALSNANEQLGEEKLLVQNQLAVFNKQMASAQAEIQASRLRVKALEVLNEKLKNEKRAAPLAVQKSTGAFSKIQVLDQRREAYATSVMDRYRQISGQLQAMTGILQANRDANANAFSSEALYRIQNTLSLANNDLRELERVNAQIRVLEKQLRSPQP